MFDPAYGFRGHIKESERDDLLDWLSQLRAVMNRRFPAGPENVALSIQQALEGKVRSTGQFTLTALTSQSTLTDARIAPNSFLSFWPRTASATTEQATGSMYSLTQANGSAVIAHSNLTASDRSFTYVVLGG